MHHLLYTAGNLRFNIPAIYAAHITLGNLLCHTAKCLGCGDPGVILLPHGGTYTIRVGEDQKDATGTYQFQIRLP